MQIAQVVAIGPKGDCKINVLFDSGSDRTYVSEKLVSKLGLKSVGNVSHRYAVFDGEKSSVSIKHVYELELVGLK